MTRPTQARPTVTVYVTSHDYGQYLRQCLQSVFDQSFDDWELLVFDDGSTDGTRSIAQEFAARAPHRVRLFVNDAPMGVRACANVAIAEARGTYLMRLDADDYLDRSALLVMAHELERDRALALVYPNWTYVNAAGDALGVERRKKLGVETEVADIPPHGACTMVRLRALKVVGGYDESLDAQDGHELWLKFVGRFKVASVDTPLFFYRQHGSSLSRDEERLLSARRAVKRRAAQQRNDNLRPRVAAIVPVKNTYEAVQNVALAPVAGKPLVDYTLDAAVESGCVDSVLVTTDDPAVVEHCLKRGDVLAELRPPELSDPTAKLLDVLHHGVDHLEQERSVFADVIVLLGIHTPLRTHEHIREAVDTLLLYDHDHVISTYEDYDLHFQHGATGMEPLNPGMVNRIRYEREALYVDNGAVHALWRDLVQPDIRLSGRVGHIAMSRADSRQIKSNEDRIIINAVLTARRASTVDPGYRQ